MPDRLRLTRWMEECRCDVIFAIRQLRAAPGFTLVAVLTLAFGIGANSAMFALADAALLRPLPFPDADRIVMVWERRPNGFRTMGSPAEFGEWRRSNRSFEAIASLAAGGTVTFAGSDGTVERVPSQTVTTTYFDVLRVQPLAGRIFRSSDVAPASDVVVLSEGFWRRRFGADPSIVGHAIVVNQRPATVVGIVPASFQFVPPSAGGTTAAGYATSIWTLAASGGSADNSHYVHVIARLKPGVTIAAATTDLAVIADQISRRLPMNAGHGIALEPLRDALIGGEVRLTSTVLLAIVGFVLLMCCANIAHLLLSKTTGRAREFAVRAALGAGGARIRRLMLIESLVLAAVGGLLGAGIGAVILRAAPALLPPGLLPNAVALRFDIRVMTFCAVAALLVGLVFGFVGAWHASGLSRVMTTDARATGAGARVRSVLVAGEIAAAVLVLCGAGLLFRTWIALEKVDPGYRVGDALAITVNLPFPLPGNSRRYDTPDALYRFDTAVEEEVRRQNSVANVAWGSAVPLDGWWFAQPFDIVGDRVKPNGIKDTASYHMVSPSYFDALRIPLVNGRAFAAADASDAPPVCIVSEAFIRQFLGGRSPLGMRVAVPMMAFGPPRVIEREIVGVAGQVTGDAGEAMAHAQIYVPLAQNAWWSASLIVVPRHGAAESLIPMVRAAIARIDKDIPPTQVRTLGAIATAATARPRFRAELATGFAGLALMLALVGVFGVLAYSVEQRTREFGVRIALGAGMRDVLSLVCAGAARMTMAGVVVGIVAAALLSRSLATLLFGIEPLDLATFGCVTVAVVAAVGVAVIVPAIRASRIDPVAAFRHE